MQTNLQAGYAYTAAEFAAAAPFVVVHGLYTFETDTGVRKLGDGFTEYADLSALPGGGGGVPAGSSSLWAGAVAVPDNADGDSIDPVTLDPETAELFGTDLALNDDNQHIDVLTAGFYQARAIFGINGSATGCQVSLNVPASGYSPDVYVGTSDGGADVAVSTAMPVACQPGDQFSFTVYAEGGTWNFESQPSRLEVWRVA